ncbi:MAG TPA: [Fe-Fe] hydrogenase large subunit C-terminal domain-containing protein [Lachnospiraceae bacterium]|nr:[Fe-Fe] hydrogenase large subunit C-terminal domain-containing protein [Lachnospiraceae bacterium]
MTTFNELYRKLLMEAINGTEIDEMEEKYRGECDANQLDCLLHPKKHPTVWRLDECDCPPDQKSECAKNCPFDAITRDEDSHAKINPEQCVGCTTCVDHCPAKKLVASKDIIPCLRAIRNHSGLSYALVAPAFLGQFSDAVTPGKLRNALKEIGFDGMVEVSLFADILTLKEALEFDHNIKNESDYQLTSCCCPVWIAMIRKIYHDLMPHVPGSVSPMIASGRTVKHMHPDALTVFIGPCMAKKSEAREPDLVGDIDYVLTFQEVNDIFEAMNIDPAKMEESEKDHSSRAGRIYARTGGVSEAVVETLKRINPNPTVSIRTKQADGVSACKAMVNELLAGNMDANFYEGMGCNGGCVGGPKRIIDVDVAKDNVNDYGNQATYPTPIDNPYVIELLHRLGFDTVESLLEDSDIFTRHF